MSGLDTTAAEKVILRINDRQGYSPDQIKDSITLGALLEAVEQAIADFGAEAMVVLDNGDRYGATFGRLSVWEDLFVAVNDEDND